MPPHHVQAEEEAVASDYHAPPTSHVRLPFLFASHLLFSIPLHQQSHPTLFILLLYCIALLCSTLLLPFSFPINHLPPPAPGLVACLQGVSPGGVALECRGPLDALPRSPPDALLTFARVTSVTPCRCRQRNPCDALRLFALVNPVMRCALCTRKPRETL